MSVKLFHQHGCPMCRAVKMSLDKKRISYEESDDIDEMKALGIMHTPVLSVDGKLLSGRDIMAWINGAEVR